MCCFTIWYYCFSTTSYLCLNDIVFTFRDRFRSITNLFAHALGVVVTYHFSASVLTDGDDDDEAENLNVFDAEIIVSD